MTANIVNVAKESAAELDLSFIVRRLERAGRPSAEAERSVEAYRRFLLVLAADPSLVLVPTKEADPAWHEHILFMEKYETDMLGVVGGRVFHYPEVRDCPIWYDGITNTRNAFRDRFGIELEVQDFAFCYISVKPA